MGLAVELIIGEHQLCAVDVGQVTCQEDNDTVGYFMLRMSMGLQTKILETASRDLKSQYGNLAYVMASIRELNKSEKSDYHFTIDDEGLVWYFDFSQPPLNIQILDAARNTFTSVDDFFKNKLPFSSKDITRVYRDKQLGFVIFTQNNGFYTYRDGEFELLYQHNTSIEYSRVIGRDNGDFWFCHQDTLFQVSAEGERNFRIGKDFILDVLSINSELYVWYGNFLDEGRGHKFSELVNYIYFEKPKYERIIGKSLVWLEDKTPNLAYHSPIVDTEGYQWIIQKERNQNTLIGQNSENKILFEETMPLKRQSKNNQSLFVKVRELYADRQNNIWVTSDNGLYKVSHRQMPFKSYLLGKSTRGFFRIGNQEYRGLLEL